MQTVIYSEICYKILESDIVLPYTSELKFLIQSSQCARLGPDLHTEIRTTEGSLKK